MEALANNRLANESDLHIFLDGPRIEEDRVAANAIRGRVKELAGFAKVELIERSENRGLASSIIDGVSTILESSEKVIVLEDDLITSPVFLDFMNDALDLYAAEGNVASIHGYNYELSGEAPETFFLRGADCWGWATWRRAWSTFNKDGLELLGRLERGGLLDVFDLDGTCENSRMLREQIAGINDSWAIRWHASSFLRGMLTLYPGRSLVQNIGNDASGTHCGTSETYNSSLNLTPLSLKKIPVQEHEGAREMVKNFFLEKVSHKKGPSRNFLHQVLQFLRLRDS